MSDVALLMGRALHAPWNEGARMIARNLAQSAALFRPVRAISLTNAIFRGQHDDGLDAEHVYTTLPYGAWSDYAALGRLMRQADALLRREPVAVAHLIGLPLALAPWLRSRGVPVVAHATLTAHAYLSRTERLRAALGGRIFGRWVDAYACSSEAVRGQLARSGCPAHKLHVVPPSIDVQRFRPRDRAAARLAHAIPPEAFVVLYIGSVSPLRFPAAEILSALHTATADIPGLQLRVIAPSVTHPANRAWIEANVRQAAEGSRVPVTIELRDLSDQHKAELYGAADVVLLPFCAPVAVEPPLTLLEAMACEATVLVSPHANRSQVVTHWQNGALFHTPEELVTRLRQLHSFGSERQAVFGAAARATVVGHYSLAAVAQALAALWGTLGRAPQPDGQASAEGRVAA